MTHELDHFRQLLADLGNAIRLQSLKPDAEGYCCLAFDEKIHVHMQLNKRTQNVVFFVELGTVNDCDKDATFQELLQANVFFVGTAGCTLGFNPKNNMATMAYQEPVRNFDFPRFQSFLKSFVDNAEKWMNRLVDIKHSTVMPDGVFKAEEYDFSNQNMISV